MRTKKSYENAKAKLLNDQTICRENRTLFAEFFDFEEYKLKRQNNLAALDTGCYSTLYTYCYRLRTVNTWFQNKPWTSLTEADIRRVYDALEDGTIRTIHGQRFADRRGYYNKIFKSKPFALAGKADLARKVIEFATSDRREVRFVKEAMFRRVVSVVANPRHLLLLWLAWDIGENINALLQLTKRDFDRQQNPHTAEVEYRVNLPQSKIKRSRLTRSELTLYPETAHFTDIVLASLDQDERIFKFGYRQAWKLLRAAVKRSNATSEPSGDLVRWKDLRSGMACHLLASQWTSDEVNARLGHAPHSKELDAYINFLAIDRHEPKRRMYAAVDAKLSGTLEESIRRERLADTRLTQVREENEVLVASLSEMKQQLASLRETVTVLVKGDESDRHSDRTSCHLLR